MGLGIASGKPAKISHHTGDNFAPRLLTEHTVGPCASAPRRSKEILHRKLACRPVRIEGHRNYAFAANSGKDRRSRRYGIGAFCCSVGEIFAVKRCHPALGGDDGRDSVEFGCYPATNTEICGLLVENDGSISTLDV